MKEFFLFPRTPFSFQELIKKGLDTPAGSRNNAFPVFVLRGAPSPLAFAFGEKFTRGSTTSLCGERALHRPVRLAFSGSFSCRFMQNGEFLRDGFPQAVTRFFHQICGKLCGNCVKLGLNGAFWGVSRFFHCGKPTARFFCGFLQILPFAQNQKKTGGTGNEATARLPQRAAKRRVKMCARRYGDFSMC